MAEETNIAKFESGDGVLHTVTVGSPAYQKMVKEGFKQLDAPSVEPDADAEPAPIDLSKLNRTGLIEKAAELGIEIDAEDKSQTKKVIIAAIEAKQAE
jgi:hypothetical protein